MPPSPTRAQQKSKASEQKAIEDAVTLVIKYQAKPEDAAKDMNAPLEKVLEALKAN